MPYTGTRSGPTVILWRVASTSWCRFPKWFLRGDWSKTVPMTHVSAAAQNLSCAGASAKPPGASTRMLVDSGTLLWFSRRVTLYRAPLYAEYSALVVLCAATQGLPAAPRMSHGPSEGSGPGGYGGRGGDLTHEAWKASRRKDPPHVSLATVPGHCMPQSLALALAADGETRAS